MRVAFFVTCLVDQFFAEAGADSVRLLRHLGCEVEFPEAQTCCGQPAFNAGHREEATEMAHNLTEVFEQACTNSRAQAIVSPSGSCTAMLRHHVPELLKTPSKPHPRPLPAFELAQFVLEELGVRDLGKGLKGRRVVLHQGCHALRDLRSQDAPRILLENAGAEVVAWSAQEECCGFGGLFSTKMPAVSAAMADRKLDSLPDVELVTSGDGGCLLQLEGRARKRKIGPGFVHIATLLWEAVDGR